MFDAGTFDFNGFDAGSGGTDGNGSSEWLVRARHRGMRMWFFLALTTSYLLASAAPAFA